MKLKYKLSLIITSTIILVLLTGLYMIAGSFLNTISMEEKRNTLKELESAKRLINNRLSTLEATVGDWAPWDDTFKYITGQNHEYVSNNLNYDTITNINIDLVFFYDREGQLKSSFLADKRSKTIKTPDIGLQTLFKLYQRKLTTHKTLDSHVTGIIPASGAFYLVSSQPITDSLLSEPKAGTLLFAAELNHDMINNLEKLINTDIILTNPNYADIKSIVKDLNKHTRAGISPTAVKAQNKKYIQGATFIKDLNGTPNIVLCVRFYRQAFNDSKQYLLKSIFIFTLLILLIGFCTILMTQKFITAPIKKLCNFLNNIDFYSSTHNSSLQEKGKDEITLIGRAINRMLERLNLSSNRLVENNKKLSLALDAANAGIWSYRFIDKRIFVDKNACRILGISENDTFLTLLKAHDYVKGHEFQRIVSEMTRLKSGKRNYIDVESKLRTSDGSYKWFLIRGDRIEDSEHKITGVSGIIIDINSRKTIEEELEYLSYHDKLTGLYNRRFFDEKIKELDLSGDMPITIIVGDINGLKLLNDSFGHAKGDTLLIEAAGVLKRSCKSSDTICRWGGDEFAIMLPNVNEKAAERVIEKIRRESRKVRVEPIDINIALGYATKDNPSKDINIVLREAEERMFKNKLLEAKIVRTEILSALLAALSKKSPQSEAHAQRVAALCSMIGKRMSLSEAENSELCLLATIHDIGKIAIPDDILVKNEGLTEEEREVMKSHTEVGYRIAGSIGDINNVAYGILSHHERYDGSGIPQGLKGNEIPLFSRIVAIADAFDVITHGRPYKKAKSVDEAISEIISEKGAQFDPELTDICVEVFKDIKQSDENIIEVNS